MKIKDLIEKLQEYDEECEVYCTSESSDYVWNGEHSEEVSTISREPVTLVRAYMDWNGSGEKAVIIL